ncbi:MAG: class Ib ribonucleoside-diphosphate reductase assembly flavoprotein NrdI [Mycoplasmatales bacterium]
MSNTFKIYYVSLSGNTKNFMKRMGDYLLETEGIILEAVNVKRLRKEYFVMNEPFATFLPAYLEGGNGIDTGSKEILTTELREFLNFENNYQYCYGIVGSGNRNFNKQFCLTAHQYSECFGFPLLDKFELRGTPEDVKRIATLLVAQKAEFEFKLEANKNQRSY